MYEIFNHNVMYTNYDVYVNNSCKVVVFVVVVIVVVVFVAAIVASSWKTDLVNNYSKKSTNRHYWQNTHYKKNLKVACFSANC